MRDQRDERSPNMPSLADVVGSPDVDPQDILVVGEYTTASGPFGDDYFLVVISRSGRVMEVPMDRADHVLMDLEQVTGTSMASQLANRTESASRVMYPSGLLNRQLYEFRSEADRPGVLHRIRRLVLQTVRPTLTDEVAALVRSREAGTGG
jgi:hypothetical protein